MPTIDEAVKNTGAVENEFAGTVAGEAAAEMPEEKGFTFDFSILFTKTGEGSIESYIEHPLNFNKSKGFAQLLRGLTGLAQALFGTGLDLAIIDVGLGLVNITKERRQAAE
jgi:hypothetical protein